MYYNKEITTIYEELKTSKDGLTPSQVQENRSKYGENKLEEAKKKSILIVFLEQFKDLLVIILLAAAVISIIAGNIDSTIVILAVLILNAVLGTIQYVKAEKSLDSLKNLSSPIAKVVRNGKRLEIPASELVVGDIIRLDAGDIVPGDGRIIESHSLKVNESSLTGESESVEKNSDVINSDAVALGDQVNMVFSSSLVTYGRGLAVVTGTGLNAELGKIASLMSNTKERKTPLQVSMDKFSKNLSIIIILLCLVVLGLDVARGMDILESLLFAVALAVAAIPESLASIITISLAIGTKKMADQNAIMKQLKAVEGLGCVSIICSDKTGTLTQNKMTVTNTFHPTASEDELLLSAILCNDTVIVDGKTTGDPTETCLVEHYFKNREDDTNYDEIMNDYPRIYELPFDSDRKMMTTLHSVRGENTMFVKGAPDVVLDRITNLTEEEKDSITEQNHEWSSSGLRVLAFATKSIGAQSTLTLDDEADLTFLGLIAMMDPPRVESATAVAECKRAGIIPIMITGDYKTTATAIAKKIGIVTDREKVVSGPELDAMSDEDLMRQLEDIRVYARVSPDNKIRIVNAWQSKGHIVAMTGDGVNDSPAIKSADVGIAMGITGTDVSKDAASMILTDDNFATIVHAVLNGRNVYANIKNAIIFLLSGNTAGILVVLYAALTALPTPFTAIHLLFINLITDSFPALAISMEPSNPNLINDRPRSSDEPILNKPAMTSIFTQGLLIGIATIVAFYIGLGNGFGIGSGFALATEPNIDVAMTMSFATLCLARLWHGFNSRGRESIFRLGILTNIYTILAFIVGGLLLLATLLIPGLQGIFLTASLTWTQLGWIAILSFAPTLIIQIFKVILDHRRSSLN